MDRSILILILVVTLVQINASALLPHDEHQRERNTPENKPPAVKHHREHRPKSHGTAETAEKKKPHELEATNRGHWEWVPDPPQNNPYMIQPPTVAPAALPTMPPMYPFYPIPMMWPSPGIPTFLPAPVQLPATNQPQHDQASENHLEKNRKTPERRAHNRSHRNNNKNHEPSKNRPKHTQSTSQHKKSEVEVSPAHDRNKNDQKTTHHKTTEDTTKRKQISDHRGDHQSVDSKRAHSTKDRDKTTEGRLDQNISAGRTRNDEFVNRESRVHSKIDSGTGHEGGNIGQGPGQIIGNAESEPKNMEKFEQKSPPSISRNSGGTKTTRT